jgi:NAD(P)-dependent dehydrogenase (short-subunit alcohol dehydrogenase family)
LSGPITERAGLRGGVDAVIVTGCSSGLGLETALHLSQNGFMVYATMRDLGRQGEVEAKAAQRGTSLRTLRLDVDDRTSIDEAVSTVIGETGGIYGLVNNAGRGLRGCVEDLTIAEIRLLFETNFLGSVSVTQSVLPYMRAAHRGRIVFLSSIAGRLGSPGLAAYCATKFAVEGLAETLNQEIVPFGLRAILIEPGIVDTPHWHSANRGIATRALNPASPYYTMFQKQEAQAERILRNSRNRPSGVARAIHHALTSRHPKMRYVVGQPASILLTLRRHIPGELFDRVYFGLVRRALTP